MSASQIATNEQRQAWPAMSLDDAHALLTAPGAAFEIERVVIRGTETPTWKTPIGTLRDALVAGTAHDAETFIVFEDERVSFDGFARAASAFAAELRASGIVKGDRVAIAMRNLAEWVPAFYGAMLCGAIVVPLNAWWLGDELDFVLRDSGARMLVVDGERLDRLRDHLAGLSQIEKIFVVGDAPSSPANAVALSALLGPSRYWESLPPPVLPDVEIAPDDDVCIMFTSGTTGMPKGAVLSHRNVISAVVGNSFASTRTALREKGQLPPPRTRRFSILCSVPLFHANGCFTQVIPVMLYGGKLVMMRKWNVEQALTLIEREEITHAGGVPTIAQDLVAHARDGEHDLSSLEALGWGGAPPPPELVDQVKRNFPDVVAANSWGMTETSGAVTQHGGGDYARRPESAGLPLPVWDIRVTDADGKALASREIGELWARGPGVIRGYWNRPEANAETFVDGWVRTGDAAMIDEAGYLYIVDRLKDMLIRGGENIYCVEIENALYDHPDVIEAAIVPIAHHKFGEVPGAVLHLREGSDLDETAILAFVANRVAAFKVPVAVAIRPAPLPRNASGKILKRELRSLFAPIQAPA